MLLGIMIGVALISTALMWLSFTSICSLKSLKGCATLAIPIIVNVVIVIISFNKDDHILVMIFVFAGLQFVNIALSRSIKHANAAECMLKSDIAKDAVSILQYSINNARHHDNVLVAAIITLVLENVFIESRILGRPSYVYLITISLMWLCWVVLIGLFASSYIFSALLNLATVVIFVVSIHIGLGFVSIMMKPGLHIVLQGSSIT